MSARKLARLAGLMFAVSAIIGGAGVSAALTSPTAGHAAVSSLAATEVIWG